MRVNLHLPNTEEAAAWPTWPLIPTHHTHPPIFQELLQGLGLAGASAAVVAECSKPRLDPCHPVPCVGTARRPLELSWGCVSAHVQEVATEFVWRDPMRSGCWTGARVMILSNSSVFVYTNPPKNLPGAPHMLGQPYPSGPQLCLTALGPSRGEDKGPLSVPRPEWHFVFCICCCCCCPRCLPQF